VLAILPQQLNKLLDEIKPAANQTKHLVISVVSGVSCQDIRKQLDLDVQVIRAMPNTAIAIGQSMTCIATDNASAANVSLVKSLFDTVGVSIQINEELMTSATAFVPVVSRSFYALSVRHRKVVPKLVSTRMMPLKWPPKPPKAPPTCFYSYHRIPSRKLIRLPLQKAAPLPA
jgi:hypothetical protein